MPNDSTSARRSSWIATVATPIGVVMLIVWAAWTWFAEAPGWAHGLLTLGVFFIIWGIVARGAPYPDERKKR